MMRSLVLCCALFGAVVSGTGNGTITGPLGDILGVQITHPFTLAPSLGEYLHSMKFDADGNHTHQYATVEEYAEALTEVYGIPAPISIRLAEMNYQLGTQLIQFNDAVLEWLDTIDTNKINPDEVTGPLIAGLNAAAEASNIPSLQAAIPVLTNMIELFANGFKTAIAIPHDVLLSVPQETLESLNDLLEHVSPVALTPQS